MDDEMDVSHALLGIGMSSYASRPEEKDREEEKGGGGVAERKAGHDKDEQNTLMSESVLVRVIDRDGARAQFEEAMANISDDEKASYAEAVRRAPHLVESESNPDRYLAYDKYDPWKAALRVANYWKTRVEIFGDDRAFLPLTLTGDGAMAPDDVKVFRTGFFMVLPNDSQGRAVLFHDRARLTTAEMMDVVPRLRCMFYVLSVMAEDESTRKNGFVILSVVGKNTRKATLEINTNTRGLSLLRSEVILTRVVAGHLVVMENRPLLSTFASLIVGAAERLNVLKNEIVVHNHGSSESDSLVQRLQRHGFDMEGIPTVPFGGLFSFGCFKTWVEDRIRLETATSNPGGAAVSVAETDVTLTEEDEKRKKKRIDAAYCRRKRFRKKIELEVMQAEVERLQQQNEKLREQGSTLEGCLREANEVVETHRRKEQEVPTYPSRVVVPRDRAGSQGEPPRSSYSVAEALLRAIRPRSSGGPLGPSGAPLTTGHGLAHPDPLHASLTPGGGRGAMPLLSPYDRLREASSILDASHRDLSSLSRLNVPLSPAANLNMPVSPAAANRSSTMDALDALRRSGLINDGALSSLLLQQSLNDPSRQHIRATPSHLGTPDPRIQSAAAAASLMASAARTTAGSMASSSAMSSGDRRRDLDLLDPYELALLQLYGGGAGAGSGPSPRFF